MNCSCIRGRYNFSINYFDTNSFLYRDFSDWMIEGNYTIPETYLLDILVPCEKKFKTFEVKTNELNRFGKEQLGCVVDGIYCFSCNSCGNQYTKNVLISNKLECCLRNAKIQYGDDKGLFEKIKEVERHLEQAKCLVEFGSIESANSQFEIAEKKLNNLKCDCSPCQ